MAPWDDETAQHYADAYGEYPTNRLGAEALDLEDSITVVDVGCGTGSALRHAATRFKGGALIGVDPVPRMVEIARARAADHRERARLEFRTGPAEALPVEDATADVVFAFDSMDHWVDRARGLAEIRRILRPQGRLVIVKDQGIPQASDGKKVLLEALAAAGFRVDQRTDPAHDAVSCTIWCCTAEP